MSSPVSTTMPPPRRQLSPRAALAWTTAMLLSFLAASSAPSPLYALYREAWGFSALTLTWVFASYAIALLGALLVFGRLSDHLGRRRVIVLALVLEIGSIVLFRQAESVAGLVAARALQGLATGMASSALSSLLVDLSPLRASVLNGIAPMLGMAVGALGTAALVQFAPAPTRLVYELLLVLLTVQALVALRLPDTVALADGAWRSLRPRLAVPEAARVALRQLLPLNTVNWALTGFFLSLGPTLARQVTGQNAPLVGGALIVALVLPAALVAVPAQRRAAARTLRVAAVAALLGLSLGLLGIAMDWPLPLYVGAMVCGFGMGCGINGTMRTLMPLAPAHQRAALMASFLVCSYLAFALPVILAGMATGWWGLHATALGYGGALLLLALATWASLLRRGADGTPTPG